MPRSSKIPAQTKPDAQTPGRARGDSQIRKANRLKDEVYREMLLLEMDRPGAEMGLALALLRVVVKSESLSENGEFGTWLKMICPVGLRMIEIKLGEGRGCGLNEPPTELHP